MPNAKDKKVLKEKPDLTIEQRMVVNQMITAIQCVEMPLTDSAHSSNQQQRGDLNTWVDAVAMEISNKCSASELAVAVTVLHRAQSIQYEVEPGKAVVPQGRKDSTPISINHLQKGKTAKEWAGDVARKYKLTEEQVASVFVAGIHGVPVTTGTDVCKGGKLTTIDQKVWNDAEEAYFRWANAIPEKVPIHREEYTFQEGDIIECDGKQFLVAKNFGLGGMVSEYPADGELVHKYIQWIHNRKRCRKIRHQEDDHESA